MQIETYTMRKESFYCLLGILLIAGCTLGTLIMSIADGDTGLLDMLQVGWLLYGGYLIHNLLDRSVKKDTMEVPE